MRMQEMLGGLRHTQRAAVVQKIETLCPADWGTEQAFEACYRKYAPEDAVQPPNRARIFQIAGIAACLLFTVGLGMNLWARQQRIEPVPPQEPVSLVTEAETKPAVPETVEDVTEPDTAPEIAAETIAATESGLTETAAPTEQMTEAEQPATEAAKPVQSEAAAPTEAAVTEAPATEPTLPEQETEAESVPAAEQLNGFQVMQYPDHKAIICTDEFPEPDGSLAHYTVLGGMELIRAEDTDASERIYEVAHNGKVFTVTQREYDAFVMDVEEGDLIDIGLSKVHGFFLLQGDACTLYWFCDGEGFCVSGDLADLQSLLAIVRSFTPVEES